jgi:hypothetical protein
MHLQPPTPYLTPVGRGRLRVHFPTLRDEDLPTREMQEVELVAHVAAATGLPAAEVRAGLEAAGALVRHVEPVGELRASTAPSYEEESYGSGVPDDTSQSGMSSAG